MFDPDSNSPKLLNVERLERKFACLTRSRESIQGLSMWIIRHKEYHQEIVDKWFDALKRDFNALNMFYVANDVIQNCARKKAPEYRDAFYAVLEKAVSLEKVKEIKSEIIRMITLWQNREIYEDAFFKKLENILNSSGSEQSEEDVVEPSEAEIIANFKLDNLVNSLRHLKTLEEELKDKQSFLEDIEEPVITNYDNIIVKLESKQEVRKFDKHQKLIEDYLTLAEKVLTAEKSCLRDLKNTNIFYTAQNEDAKKVAQAYRIYAKKIRIVEKSLLEKLLNFPVESPNSSTECLLTPVLESDISQTSLTNASPSKSVDTKSTFLSHSPTATKNDAFDSTIIEKSKNVVEKAIDLVTTECSTSESCGLTEEPNKSRDSIKVLNLKDSLASAVSDVSVGSISPAAVVAAIPVSPLVGVTSKSPTKDSDVVLSSSSKSSDVVSPSASKSSSLATPSSTSKLCNVVVSPTSQKSPVFISSKSSSSTAIDNLKAVIPDILKTIAPSEASSPVKSVTLPDTENTDDIDFLLDKAYNAQVKPKTNYKRKIDALLKLKQAKSCKLDTEKNEQESANISDEVKPSFSDEIKEPSPSEAPVNTFPMSSTPMEVVTPEEKNLTISLLQESIPVQSDSLKKEQACEALKADVIPPESTTAQYSPSVATDEQSNVSEVKNTVPSISLGLQTLSEIPTELLQNILNRHKINMDSNMSSFSSTLGSKKAEELSQTEKTSTDSSKKESCSEKMSSQDLLPVDIKEPACEDVDKKVDEYTDSKDKVDETINNISGDIKLQSNNFFESVQNVLNCFSKKEKSPHVSQQKNPFQHCPSLPLENTLQLYSFLMKYCGKEDLINEQTNSLTNLNRLPILQTNQSNQINKNVHEVSSEKDFLHQADNLEVMDMEVDSGDSNG